MEPPAKLLGLSELGRMLANVVRYGAIHDVDRDRAMARVVWAQGEDGNPVLTGWLPFATAMAGEDRDWRPPSPGEHVILLAPSGELASAVILAGVNTGDFPAPDASPHKHVTLYRDGARIEYDAEMHKLSALLPAGGSAAIEAPDGVTIDGDVTITGDVGITGDATATGTIGADGKISSKAEIADPNGSMQEMRTTYNAHVHGVAPGPVTPPPAPTSRMT